MSKTRDYLGPYRLTRLIRVGSTAEVWEAVDEPDQKQTRYALKILRQSVRGDKAELALLKHEYNVGKDLVSPRVIKLVEYRVESDTPFLVLELFSEMNLKQALRKGPESIAYMLDKVISQAAEGLYYLHTQNWIHRDIKPDNYLVDRDGTVKLIDFTISTAKKTGLSKLFGKPKVIQGTRSYMAPEQIRGKICDERTDIYSFGCVLFECATGKPPYTGQTPNDLLSKHLSASVPSPIVHNDNLTKEFAALTKRMMAKNPEDRLPSMWEFLKEFRAMEVFKKKPRVPKSSVFDDLGGIKGADDMIRRSDDLGEDEEEDQATGGR